MFEVKLQFRDVNAASNLYDVLASVANKPRPLVGYEVQVVDAVRNQLSEAIELADLVVTPAKDESKMLGVRRVWIVGLTGLGGDLLPVGQPTANITCQGADGRFADVPNYGTVVYATRDELLSFVSQQIDKLETAITDKPTLAPHVYDLPLGMALPRITSGQYMNRIRLTSRVADVSATIGEKPVLGKTEQK